MCENCCVMHFFHITIERVERLLVMVTVRRPSIDNTWSKCALVWLARLSQSPPWGRGKGRDSLAGTKIIVHTFELILVGLVIITTLLLLVGDSLKWVDSQSVGIDIVPSTHSGYM